VNGTGWFAQVNHDQIEGLSADKGVYSQRGVFEQFILVGLS